MKYSVFAVFQKWPFSASCHLSFRPITVPLFQTIRPLRSDAGILYYLFKPGHISGLWAAHYCARLPGVLLMYSGTAAKLGERELNSRMQPVLPKSGRILSIWTMVVEELPRQVNYWINTWPPAQLWLHHPPTGVGINNIALRRRLGKERAAGGFEWYFLISFSAR